MPLRRLAALVPVLLAAIAAGFLLPHSPSQLRDIVLAAGVAAPAIVLAAWVVLTPALFPGTLLAAVGGMAFGTAGGIALALGGALLERRGFAAILAARLMPGVPASGLYYAAGVSPVRYGAFTAAIAIGALLRTTPYALLGDSLGSGSVVSLAIAAASVAIGGGAALLITRRL
jgi:uncharacterized membrane protein YdjX (TVP38/TMEM64 family)